MEKNNTAAKAKKAAKKAATEKASEPEVKLACVVIADSVRVGNMLLLKGKRFGVSEKKAQPLVDKKLIQIEGVL